MIDPGMIEKDLMEYFRELSPTERRNKLESLTDLDDTIREFCTKLYDDRYYDAKRVSHSVDNWLWKIVYLTGLYNKKRLFKKALFKEAELAIKDLHLTDTESYSDMEKTLLYLEFRNAAKRYLSTCDSPGYATTLFGLKKSSDEAKKRRAAQDIWNASRGIAIESGETDKLEIWCLALRDEIFQYDETSKSHYTELDNN